MNRAVVVVTYLALAVLLLGAAFIPNGYVLSLASRAAIFAAAAVSLQFVVGYAGLQCFGHAAFLGVGAYALLALASYGFDDAALSLPAAMAAAGVFALLTGWLALRTRGVTFIMITLAFGQMAYFIAGSLAVFGGDDGTALDRRPPVLRHDWLDDPSVWYAVVLGVLLLWLLLSHALGASRFGRALRAARESEARAAASGFNVRALHLAAYTLSGTATGACGWLLAVQTAYVSPALLEWRNSGSLLVMVILGGVTTPGGAALAAVLLVLAEEGLAAYSDHARLVLGPLLVLLALRRAIWRPRT
jgi:branched-chain amino acid transport system permease protein